MEEIYEIFLYINNITNNFDKRDSKNLKNGFFNNDSNTGDDN